MRGIGANSASERTRSGWVAANRQASAVPSVSASTVGRSQPAASSTASTSSICSSSGAGGTRSDMPLPRRSNWTRRANDVRRANIRASRGSVHRCSICETQEFTSRTSCGPSPATSYASETSPLRA